MAILIEPNGKRTTVRPAGKYFTAEELHQLVGGYFEMLHLPNGKLMWINEDGKGLGLPYNKQATGYAILAGIANNDYIVGNAVITSPEEVD